MHDESPGGQACADRTLAYWKDQSNFSSVHGSAARTGNANAPRSRKTNDELSNTQRFGAGFLIGTILAAMIGG